MPPLLALLAAYFLTTAALIFVLLFGEAPWAAGTPLATASWLVREAWVDALEWVVRRCCGAGGLRLLDAATEACCERRTPVLQFAYLGLWSGCYALYWSHVFTLLPASGVPAWHLYTGTAALCATLGTFLVASAASPGVIDADNAARYLAAYPPDGVLFPAKACATCQLPRLGRSKHCGLCGSCIPRFDHFCGWINQAVGLHNMRAFLAFLAANAATAAYALGLGVAVMRGELARRGLLDVFVYDPATRSRVPIYTRPARFAELLLAAYPVQLALGLFAGVAGLMVAGFLAYQVWLISVGCTTYEAFKRNQVAAQRRQEAAAAAALEAAAAGGDKPASSDEGWAASLLPWRRRQRQSGSPTAAVRAAVRAARARVAVPRLPYHRGLAANWAEVLWPDAFLLDACHQRRRAGVAGAGGAGGTAAEQGQQQWGRKRQ